MSFDGIFTHALVQELKNKLDGGIVNRIDQPYSHELILVIRAQRKNYRLLLSAHSQYSRVQLTEIPYENPQQPPQFTMVLRKYLNRARLLSIHQVENDRIIVFSFSSRDELGDEKELQLIVETMGRHSNVILMDTSDNRILETIKHVPPYLNSYRTLLPGAQYIPAPPQDKLNPFESSQEQIEDALENSTKETLTNRIQDILQGIGRDTAQELALRSNEDNKQFYSALKSFKTNLEFENLDPRFIEIETKAFFTPIAYEIYADESQQSYPSLSELLDAYYGEIAQRDRVHQLSKEISNLLDTEYDKAVKKRDKQRIELEETQQADEYRVIGEVLTAYMHTLKRGDQEAVLPNFYDNNSEITIELNPLKTPAENAQAYFSLYQKMKNRRNFLSHEILKTQTEIDYLDSALTQLAIASPNDIEGIRQELISQGYVKQKTSKKKPKVKKSKPENFYSSDGTLIQVGKNNQMNDDLTMKTAQKDDIWLHTKDIPGSHVVIRNNNPSEETILEAAELAAYHSKASQSSNVPVDYVAIKHVRKPQGAKPGFVIYDNQSTVFVTPERKNIEQLRKNKEI